jgi:hypothetical protein
MVMLRICSCIENGECADDGVLLTGMNLSVQVGYFLALKT